MRLLKCLLFLLIPASLGAQNWRAFSNFSPDDFVVDMVVYENELYVCGFFKKVGLRHVNHIAKWNGVIWEPLGTGLDDWAHSMLVTDDGLYVTGYFTHADGIRVDHIAKWDGDNWHSVGRGFNDNTFGIALFRNEIYVGGEFTKSGPDSVAGLAKWDGQNWIQIGNPINGSMDGYPVYIHGITSIGDSLYLGGNFENIGTLACGGIAIWDGHQFYSMGAGFNESGVLDIKKYNNQIWAAGLFNKSGNETVSNIAIWENENWRNPPDINGMDGYVHTLESIEGDLFLSGGFTKGNTAGLESCSGICRFDGEAWSGLGQGLNGPAEPMLEWNNRLLVGGDFTGSDAVPTGRLALFDGLVHTRAPEMNKTAPLSWHPAENMVKVMGNPLPKRYFVSNCLGQIQQKGKIHESEIEIGPLPTGIYYMVVQYQDGTKEALHFQKQ
jgi:hypothetical protein